MTGWSTRREHYVEALAHNLDGVIAQLVCIPAVQKVTLFGSYAAGAIYSPI
ncbi:MAG: hypothetical protein H5T69_02550 [Chloroflexi bacterium]|nr:hypothetical protein [Chloroflexota bacterium]